MQPEEQIASREIYDGKIIKVRVDDILMRSGTKSVREVVDHANAVVIAPIDADDNVLLVRQYRYAAGQSLLEAPAGLIEEGEDPDDCAQRELAEEIGFASRDLRILGGFWSSPGFCTEFMYAYLAKDLVPRSLQADDDEDIEVEKVPSIPHSSANKARRNPGRQEHRRATHGNLHLRRLNNVSCPSCPSMLAPSV